MQLVDNIHRTFEQQYTEQMDMTTQQTHPLCEQSCDGDGDGDGDGDDHTNNRAISSRFFNSFARQSNANILYENKVKVRYVHLRK